MVWGRQILHSLLNDLQAYKKRKTSFKGLKGSLPEYLRQTIVSSGANEEPSKPADSARNSEQLL